MEQVSQQMKHVGILRVLLVQFTHSIYVREHKVLEIFLLMHFLYVQ